MDETPLQAGLSRADLAWVSVEELANPVWPEVLSLGLGEIKTAESTAEAAHTLSAKMALKTWGYLTNPLVLA